MTSGPPEACDPGEAPEIEIESVTCLIGGGDLTLTQAEEDRFQVEVLENWDGDDGGPDPDDLRDQRRDDALTRRDE